MALYEIGNDGSINKIAGNVASIIDSSAGMPLGLIFASAIPITDARVHLLDGTTIAQNGVYASFVSLIKNLISSGENISCTQSQYDSDIATYGQCGKFVIDDANGLIRLPKITEFIASNNGGLTIGLAQLDEFKSHTHTQASHKHSISNPYQATSGNEVMVPSTSGTAKLGAASYAWTPTGSATPTINNTGGTETRPKNIRYPYYIVLATGYKSVQSLNVDAIMTELNKKGNDIQYLSESDKKKWFLLTHPIDSYYITDETKSPIDNYGGGWAKVEGRFLIGAGGNGDGATYTFSHTGGSKDAIVVSHSHENVYIKVRTNKAGIGNDYGTSGNHIVTNTGASNYGRVDMAYTSTVGSSGTDMNMPPYKVVYIWKRIS